VPEPLQVLRRGLQRADGFALFIAVCNSPARSRELIKSLKALAPETSIEVVELGADIEQPLDAVLAKIPEDWRGPLAVMRLERSNPSSLAWHPVLSALNLSRPEWPRYLPVPLVFWVPEYLLGLMEREAPDFMDWRSDTIFFTDNLGEELPILDLGLWTTSVDDVLPVAQRRRRIEELRLRLEDQRSSDDRLILSARSQWLSELGDHLLLLGDFEEAKKNYLDALSIEENLGRRGRKASIYLQLGSAFERLGSLEEAGRMIENSCSIEEDLWRTKGMAAGEIKYGSLLAKQGQLGAAHSNYWGARGLSAQSGNRAEAAWALVHLAQLQLRFEDVEKSMEFSQQALDTFDSIGDLRGSAAVCGVMAQFYARIGDLVEAEKMAVEALRINKMLGDPVGTATCYYYLGNFSMRRGDLTLAEEMLLKALDTFRQVGYREGIANSLSSLGRLKKEDGDLQRAHELWSSAVELYGALGMLYEQQRVNARLSELSLE
jgi:tetratricopeptide (TPR) repeat protein